MSDRVFITGGASGLGRAIALRYARAGARVLIGDVHEARGEKTRADIDATGGEGRFMRLDVTQEADLQQAAAAMQSDWGGADVVVNNAGIATTGFLDEEPLSSWQRVLDINLLGVVRGIKAFLPLLRAQQSGHFVNIASMAGIVHPPKSASYSATKAAVVAVSEALKLEVEDDGIQVMVVCPSFFRTNLHESLEGADEAMVQRLFDRSPISADDIADMIHAGVRKGQFYLLPHREGRLANWLKRLGPRRLYFSVLRKQSRVFLKR